MRSLYNEPSALIFYAMGKKTGGSGGGGTVDPPTGDWIVRVTDTVDGYFTQEEMKHNAPFVWYYFRSKGWEANPTIALLGNIEGESGFNPGLIEVGGGTTSAGPGRGLVQWTPGTVLMTEMRALFGTDEQWFDGNKQLACMWAEYEVANGLASHPFEGQWITTSSYPVSYEQWAHDTTHDLEWLVYAFMANYLRPGTINHPERVDYARKWASFFIKG